MAGDWIRMRAELFHHPKFISLCNHLVYQDESAGLLLYACGPDALGIGALPPSNESVTARALRCITEPALRDVCMCSLLRVWGAVNAHCKIIDADAVMSPMRLYDLDDVAGFSGFGNAMSHVGWVIEAGDKSLLFPNFLEFNEPARLRPAPLTNAERQRAWRERQRETSPPNGTVTAVTKSNDRGEESVTDTDTSTDTVTRGTPTLVLDDFDWEAIRSDCKKLIDTIKPRSQQDRDLLIKSVVLSRTTFSGEWLWTAARGAKHKKAGDQFRYFHGALKGKSKDLGQNFNLLLKQIDIPDHLRYPSNGVTSE